MSSNDKSENASTESFTYSFIAEDDRSRSHYMEKLIRAHNTHTTQATSLPIPRLLIQFWDDAKQIPEDVQHCLDSWASVDNQGFRRLLFDDTSAQRFIGKNLGQRYVSAFDACRHPAMRSDYFRLCFILKNGGLYVDADDTFLAGDLLTWFHENQLFLQPLCYDIVNDSMVDRFDLSAILSEPHNYTVYVNNNPLIAPAQHPVIRMALERSTQTLLASSDDRRDIQSMTGPGNLTASLVQHAIDLDGRGKEHDFAFLKTWDSIARSQWPLEYRGDERNWRVWKDGNA